MALRVGFNSVTPIVQVAAVTASERPRWTPEPPAVVTGYAAIPVATERNDTPTRTAEEVANKRSSHDCCTAPASTSVVVRVSRGGASQFEREAVRRDADRVVEFELGSGRAAHLQRRAGVLAEADTLAQGAQLAALGIAVVVGRDGRLALGDDGPPDLNLEVLHGAGQLAHGGALFVGKLVQGEEGIERLAGLRLPELKPLERCHCGSLDTFQKKTRSLVYLLSIGRDRRARTAHAT